MSDRPIVEVEKAPCRHLHSSNYDPAKVVRGQPVEVIGSGRMWCFDCEKFFTYPPPRAKSYTLDDLTCLAAEWITEQEGDTEMLKWTFSIFIEYARKREREVGDVRV